MKSFLGGCWSGRWQPSCIPKLSVGLKQEAPIPLQSLFALLSWKKKMSGESTTDTLGNFSLFCPVASHGGKAYWPCLKPWVFQGFTGGSVVKNLPASARDTGSIPDPGRFHIPWSKSVSLCFRAQEPQLLSPCAPTTGACVPRARALQWKKPLQWEAHTLQRE